MSFILRDHWEFEYTAAKLADAAEAQHGYRKGRLVVWQDKKKEVMEKIKETGLTIHENLAEKMYGTTSNQFNPLHHGAQVLVDPTMQQDLNEAEMKIKEHRDASKVYDGWVQVLRANPEARLKLTHEDWLFFFGK
jgi:hypothetical protein